ncbi:MAG: hypothetical protein ACI9GM_000078 [Salibacteraceae bacterium]|jgi:hypothetical protein
MKYLLTSLTIIATFFILSLLAVVLLFGHRDIPFKVLKATYTIRPLHSILYQSYSFMEQQLVYTPLRHGQNT